MGAAVFFYQDKVVSKKIDFSVGTDGAEYRLTDQMSGTPVREANQSDFKGFRKTEKANQTFVFMDDRVSEVQRAQEYRLNVGCLGAFYICTEDELHRQ